MALITCPECGKPVSDSANACPFCGYPIRDASPKTVRIDLPSVLEGAEVGVFARKNGARVYVGGNIVWSGPMGTTAVFEIQKKEAVSIMMDYGTSFASVEGDVVPGRRYTVEFLRYKGLGLLKMPIYRLFEE